MRWSNDDSSRKLQTLSPFDSQPEPAKQKDSDESSHSSKEELSHETVWREECSHSPRS